MAVSTDLVVGVLGAGGLGAIIAAIFNGLFSKRKLGAEATEIITKAAAGVVTNLENEIKRQQRVNTDLIAEHRATIRTLMLNHAEEIEEWRRTAQQHIAWDYTVKDRLALLGVEVPDPPPLTPARRFPKPDLPVD